MSNGVSRRRFLKGTGALGAAVAASPLLSRLAWAAHGEFLDPAPFEYGVASGDPLPGSVLIWTRVSGSATSVTWKVATDSGFSTIVATGTAGVSGANDRCVTVDVTGLSPATTYYYKFETGADTSAIGRTRTAPDPASSPGGIRFAVTSCQDFQGGYYHAWEHIAARAGGPGDLDFVLFLGDYIYEYADDGDGFRNHDPAGEILTISDYRARYRNYRTDPHLREAHRLYPFVCVWDDHEVANDRWGIPEPGGAENHQAGEGDYLTREAAGEQAYFEYLPVRHAPDAERQSGRRRIWRNLSYGDLAEVIAIDTRSYRNQPIGTFVNPSGNFNNAISDPARTLLGPAQKAWLKDLLANSPAKWKLVGNQIMIGHLTFGFLPDPVSQALSQLTGQPPWPPNSQIHRDGIPVNYDQWDGYQPERREILTHIRDSGTDNVVFLTGDIHTSWAMELLVNPGNLHEAPVGVEFVGPSVTSINLNELAGDLTIGAPLPHRSSAPVEAVAIANNPHMRYVELDSNGYIEVDVSASRVRATYYHAMNPITEPHKQPATNPAAFVAAAPGGSWQVLDGLPRLLPAI